MLPLHNSPVVGGDTLVVARFFLVLTDEGQLLVFIHTVHVLLVIVNQYPIQGLLLFTQRCHRLLWYLGLLVFMLFHLFNFLGSKVCLLINLSLLRKLVCFQVVACFTILVLI